ncbi:MAG: HAMP domain-containing protein [Prevotella sp.]|nr:HAMP domain-containing protein [Prevotella sp.]
MKSLKDYRRSLSARLSVWTVLVVTAIFLAALTMMFTESQEHVRIDTLGKARQTLDGTVLHIENTLRAVEVAANNMLRVVEDNLDKPDKMMDYSRQVLENNPNLDGCSISFEPFYYKEKGEYYSAYSYNNGDSIATENEGADYYQYHTMDWYLIPKLLNRPYWIEPFQEDAEEGIVVQDIFTSYSQPIHDKTGKVVGTFSVDICLDWFSDTVSATKPFPNSYTILLGKGGTFLVHPDSTRQFYETVFTSSLKDADPVLESLGEAMTAGESGYRTMTINGELSHVFFKPFKNTGWSVAMVCPESDIFAAFRQLRRTVQIVTAIGLLLLLLSTWYIVSRSVRPLQKLVDSTHQMMQHEFTGDIPDSTREDEIGQLQRRFKAMQQSLGKYVNKVRQQSAVLEERHAELQQAYERAKEEEHVRNAVLHNMTKRMSGPVADIAAVSRTICEEYQDMTDDYMDAMVGKIDNDANQVGELLNELLRAAQEDSNHPQTEKDS